VVASNAAESSEELVQEQPARESAQSEEDKDALVERLKQQLTGGEVITRVPDLPKPPVYSGFANDMVEDHLFVLENTVTFQNSVGSTMLCLCSPMKSWPHGHLLLCLQNLQTRS